MPEGLTDSKCYYGNYAVSESEPGMSCWYYAFELDMIQWDPNVHVELSWIWIQVQNFLLRFSDY